MMDRFSEFKIHIQSRISHATHKTVTQTSNKHQNTNQFSIITIRLLYTLVILFINTFQLLIHSTFSILPITSCTSHFPHSHFSQPYANAHKSLSTSSKLSSLPHPFSFTATTIQTHRQKQKKTHQQNTHVDPPIHAKVPVSHPTHLLDWYHSPHYSHAHSLLSLQVGHLLPLPLHLNHS